MKIYTSKSNAQRAAKKLEVAEVVEVEGGWEVRVPDTEADPGQSTEASA